MIKLSDLSASIATMQSLVKRLENQEHLTSKGFASSASGVPSSLLRIESMLELTSRSVMELHDKINLIAAKQETLGNMVNVLMEGRPTVTHHEMPSPLSSFKLPTEEELGYMNSLLQDQEPITIPDLNCYETIWATKSPLIDLTLESSGSMGLRVSGSPEGHIETCQELTSRTQEQNGGMDTSSKKTSSSMIWGPEA